MAGKRIRGLTATTTALSTDVLAVDNSTLPDAVKITKANFLSELQADVNTRELASNKTTVLSAPNDVQFPTIKAVTDSLGTATLITSSQTAREGINELKTEIDTIVVNASVDPEVALARISGVKSETFATLDARLEDIEQLHADLSSTDINKGASLVGINDAGSKIIATTVEEALQEMIGTDVHLTGDQTIAGIKTFSSSPIVPTPTTDMQTSTKKYTDDADALKMNLAGGSGNPFTAMPFVGVSEIVASGSNANGQYVKYSDGTLICSVMLTAFGVLTGNENSVTWTYPIALLAGSQDLAQIALTTFDSTAREIHWTITNKSATAAVIGLAPSGNKGNYTYCSVLLKGQWK